EMVERGFELKGMKLRTEVEPDLPMVFVDRTRIRQVLLNLVNNSLRFTDRGSVTMRLRRYEDNSLLVSVEDTGTGIAQEDLPKIFEEFRQVSKDSWRRREGAGLGIPISKSFIELHGGQMWVESELGKGTTFFFTIPKITKSESAEHDNSLREERFWRSLKEKAEQGRSILVISQDPAAGDIIAPYIEGYSLITVSQVHDLASQVAALLPFAIFLDQTAAKDPQIQTEINQLPYDLPVISFNFPGNPTHPHDLPDCVRHYLVKPFTNQVLVDAILSLGQDVQQLLVVDDDPAMINLVTRALVSRLNGRNEWLHHLTGAATGRDAINHIQKNAPDAILLDVSLPDISGWEILKEAQQRDIPVVFITAHEWPQAFPSLDYEALRIQLRRPLSRYELPLVLKNLLEVIHPKYPADLSGLIHPAAQPG
ncbi:MAG: ATP-binding protein, partial [Candidatus Marsarchaeota archaeon]|nr:ATP-binding protein [Candidatus Marsarchaeota archaeon]